MTHDNERNCDDMEAVRHGSARLGSAGAGGGMRSPSWAAPALQGTVSGADPGGRHTAAAAAAAVSLLQSTTGG